MTSHEYSSTGITPASILERLPYPVPLPRIEKWFEQVCARDPGRVQLHLERALRPFTGARVVPLVAEFERAPNLYNKCARDVAAEVLLHQPPGCQTSEMRREIVLEPVIRALFREGAWAKSYGIPWDRVRFLEPEPLVYQDGKNGPVFSGRPGDMFELGGRIFAVDYEAPISPSDALEEGRADVSNIQTAIYMWLLEKNGAKPGGRIVCALDYRNFALDIRAVDPGAYQQIVSRIQNAAHHFHTEYFRKDLLPEYRPRPAYVFEDESDRSAMEDIAREMLSLKVIADTAYKGMNVCKKAIADRIGGYALNGRLDLAGGQLQISPSSILDRNAAEALLAANGIEMPTTKKKFPDWDAVVGKLKELNIPEHKFHGQELKFTLPSGKGELAQKVSTLKSMSEGLVNDARNRIRSVIAAATDARATQPKEVPITRVTTSRHDKGAKP